MEEIALLYCPLPGKRMDHPPSDDRDIVHLRPLPKRKRNLCIYKPLPGRNDRIEPAQFPLPDPEQVWNAVGTNLLFNASPFTCAMVPDLSFSGRISVRPVLINLYAINGSEARSRRLLICRRCRSRQNHRSFTHRPELLDRARSIDSAFSVPRSL